VFFLFGVFLINVGNSQLRVRARVLSQLDEGLNFTERTFGRTYYEFIHADCNGEFNLEKKENSSVGFDFIYTFNKISVEISPYVSFSNTDVKWSGTQVYYSNSTDALLSSSEQFAYGVQNGYYGKGYNYNSKNLRSRIGVGYKFNSNYRVSLFVSQPRFLLFFSKNREWLFGRSALPLYYTGNQDVYTNRAFVSYGSSSNNVGVNFERKINNFVLSAIFSLNRGVFGVNSCYLPAGTPYYLDDCKNTETNLRSISTGIQISYEIVKRKSKSKSNSTKLPVVL